ncbi:N-acetyltransferase [Terrihabitans rhizophilus]|uniref:N-acetyltransferase n=1 Tax=Terrihabitans rhizophilus TaxID=3092662 RepID=A0ABU4RRR2_9HYPH|nr:N-acetyltransferase [Terrihabitans sp. PJ23]MDX6806365.1 N-acetyltransferase [Terrihabitans sp. PJ23]
MTLLSLDIGPESPDLAPAIDKLHERAFGPGRFARSAFRLREGVAPLPELSFVAKVATLLVGSVRLTPIRIGTAPALLLGPLTVEPAFMGRGIGSTLMERSIAAAREGQHALILLVGDEPYYGRFGFRRVPPGRIAMPGPVDPARVLICELQPGAFVDVSGPANPGGL